MGGVFFAQSPLGLMFLWSVVDLMDVMDAMDAMDRRFRRSEAYCGGGVVTYVAGG